MNEQLVVKNFGPIKDATVDFKRVTVFIGPTGGGKSTLAKLAAILKSKLFHTPLMDDKFHLFKHYSVNSFLKDVSFIKWHSNNIYLHIENKNILFQDGLEEPLKKAIDDIISDQDRISEVITEIARERFRSKEIEAKKILERNNSEELLKIARESIISKAWQNLITKQEPHYFPAERIFVASLEYSWAGLMRDDIGLSKLLLDFANQFSTSRREISELNIPFLNARYFHVNGRDFIKISTVDELFMLLETASGIQSVAPLLVLLEHLSRNIEQAQSFIIEEPELNLFPLAQFELVKILVEKCAQTNGKNDLVLTTHSPYVLTALNLLCYAYRIAQQDEATARKVAKLIPRHCWIDPDQFAAYYVDRPDTKRKQQVRSIINKKTGLIDENELDTASDELGSIFDKLVKLRKPTSTPARAK